MSDCMNIEQNKRNCTCTSSCSRKGNCCACISYHRSKGEIPGCLFSPEAEKEYDRSVEFFVEINS